MLIHKCGFSGEYIDSLAPYDRDLYLLYFKEEVKLLKEREQKESSSVNNSRGPTIGSLPDLGV